MTKITPQAGSFNMSPSSLVTIPTMRLNAKDCSTSLRLSFRRSMDILLFEFGPRGSTREFVISAAGIKDAFPGVVRLANAAAARPDYGD
jgi:hypothetical protein